MKLTYEEKLRIYDLWKNQHYSPRRIAKQYNINGQVIRYMVNLMDRHGVEIVKHGKQKYYSPDFNINAIDRVLLNHESSVQVSLDLGLPNVGMLSQWIQSFKENCYTIVEKQRGRKSYDQKESKDDTGTIRE